MTGPVVVVGGGLAAGTLVTELRENAYDGPVTVLCEEPHPPYERPPLTKSFLRKESSVEDTYLHPASWYVDHDVTLHTGTRVRSVDLAGRTVSTDRGEHGYARLVLATGCRARLLPLASTPEVAVHHLRTVDDAAMLQDALGDGIRLLVVGGGWIGLEVAASARALGAAVTVVEPAPQPLAGTLGLEVGAWFAELHRSHGVDLRTGVGIGGLDGGAAVLEDGTRLDVDLVVVGIGAVPNDTLAREAGLDVDNGVLVDSALVASHPDVLAIGDVASQLHPVLGERVRVEHWQNALSHGRVAAQVLAGKDVVHDELPSFFSDQYDAGLEFFGHLGHEPAQATVDRTENGLVVWWHRSGRLVAAAHVNEWERSAELAQLVARGSGTACR
jgi:3-phenylpropionate/trans-cinnamate dioxygenase ferredoxin reductase subunit